MTDTSTSAVGVARAKPERAAELAELLLSFAELSRAEPGCLHSVIHRDRTEENVFVFVETWASQQDQDRHLEQPYMQKFLQESAEYLSAPLEVRILGPVTPQDAPEAGQADPAAMNQRYLDAYAARDIDAIMAVYAPGAAAVWQPGKAVTGADHREAVAEFLKREPQLSASVRDSYIVGDTAALIIDWHIEVPDDPAMTGSGTGFDVLRREPDGRWRYIITNPFGSV